MPDKPSLFADLRRALAGLAYADAAEYLPQRDKEVLLGAAHPRPTVGPTASCARGHRRIALAIQNQVRPGALRYARSACERLDADLDILTSLTQGGLGEAIHPPREGLVETGGPQIEIIRLGRDILRGVVHYARSRRGLLFVVVSAEDGFAERVITGLGDSRRLGVPWVVVAAADAA